MVKSRVGFCRHFLCAGSLYAQLCLVLVKLDNISAEIFRESAVFFGLASKSKTLLPSAPVIRLGNTHPAEPAPIIM